MTITFEVKGKPQGKARARTFYDKRCDKMRSITPEKTKDYESLIRWSYTAAGGQYFDTAPIGLCVLSCAEIVFKVKEKQGFVGRNTPTE